MKYSQLMDATRDALPASLPTPATHCLADLLDKQHAYEDDKADVQQQRPVSASLVDLQWFSNGVQLPCFVNGVQLT
jgi:hypothetical protein